MDKAIVVLVGEWECSGGGSWDFILQKKCMAQCIMVEDGITYAELRRLIETEFGGEMPGVVGIMAYRLPSQMSVFSSDLTPPVSITSNSGVNTFMKVREGTRGLNLFVTFEAPTMSQVECEGRSAGRIEDEIIRLDDGTPDFQNLGDENNGSDDRRDEVAELAQPTENGQSAPCTMIELNNLEEEQMLAEVEKIEAMVIRAEEETDRKGKETGTVQSNCTSESEDSEEAAMYSSEDEEDNNYDKFAVLIDKEYQVMNREGWMEIGEPADGITMLSVPETQEDVMPTRRKGKEPITEEWQREMAEKMRYVDKSYASELEEDAELERRIGAMENKIADAEILGTEDCPPCFGDEFIQTQEVKYGEYDPRNDAIYVGKVFKNKQAMRTALGVYAVKRFFNFKQVKSDTKRLIVECVDRGCPWRVYGLVVGGGSGNIEIRTARLLHTCDEATRSGYGKKATSKVIAEVLKSKYANGKEGPRAAAVPAIVLDELSVSVTYMKGWHAREQAVAQARETADGSYKLLMSYLHRLKHRNQGTITVVEKTEAAGSKTKFKCLFFALGACVEAVKYMRKVVVVDATTIKSKFRGCLLTASCQDWNFQIFPIGFGVVNSENDNAWAWFFTQLAEIIPDNDDLVFVSDRHSSIAYALKCVYPRATHGACAVHIYRNVKARFNKYGVACLMSQAASAYTEENFHREFDEIERRSAACASYLRGIGVARWARAFYRCKRYNVTNSNIAESLNRAVGKALEFPIVTMVESIRLMLMRWFYERREEANKRHM